MPETTVVVPSQHSMLSCGPNRFNRELTHFAEIKIPEKPIENLLIPSVQSTPIFMVFQAPREDDELQEIDLKAEMSILDRAHEEALEARIVTFLSGEMNKGAVWPTLTVDSLQETDLQAELSVLDSAIEETRKEVIGTFPSGDMRQGTLWPTFVVDSLQEADLKEALSDLDSAVDEAREEEFDTLPSDEVIENARRILQQMYEMHRCRYEVYPTQDGEIAISASAEHRRSVLMICDKEGGALCSVSLNGRHRQARYDSAADLPVGFVREALAELV